MRQANGDHTEPSVTVTRQWAAAVLGDIRDGLRATWGPRASTARTAAAPRASHVGATHDAALAVNPAPMQMKPAAAAIAAGSPLEISG